MTTNISISCAGNPFGSGTWAMCMEEDDGSGVFLGHFQNSCLLEQLAGLVEMVALHTPMEPSTFQVSQREMAYICETLEEIARDKPSTRKIVSYLWERIYSVLDANGWTIEFCDNVGTATARACAEEHRLFLAQEPKVHQKPNLRLVKN